MTKEAGAGRVSEAQVERGAVAVLGVLATGTDGPFRCPRKHLALQTRPKVAFGGAQVYVIGRTRLDNGNSGAHGIAQAVRHEPPICDDGGRARRLVS